MLKPESKASLKKLRILLGSGGMGTAPRKKLWRQEVDRLLGKDVRKILFIPYALKDHDRYLAMVAKRNLGAGRKIIGIHRTSDPVKAVLAAQAIFVGGGNTFRLLRALHDRALLHPIRRQVRRGIPYLGVSAGTNVATPKLGPTNDMPIVNTPFKALGLVNTAINPHYLDGAFYSRNVRSYVRHHGETRDERISEYLEENPGSVLALYEGTIVRVQDGRATLLGAESLGGRIFRMSRRDKTPRIRPLKPGADITRILFPGRATHSDPN